MILPSSQLTEMASKTAMFKTPFAFAASRMENISIDANIIYLTEANSTVDSFIMCENEKSLILNMSSNHLRWLIALIE